MSFLIYYSFCSDAIRSHDGHPLHLPDVGGEFTLTIYQDHVGIPAWASDWQQFEHPDWQTKELSTTAIVDWHEENLSLAEFFRTHHSAIRSWRQTYTVQQSERYLLAWHVLGLYAARRGANSYVYGCWGDVGEVMGHSVLKKLPTTRPRECLI